MVLDTKRYLLYLGRYWCIRHYSNCVTATLPACQPASLPTRTPVPLTDLPLLSPRSVIRPPVRWAVYRLHPMPLQRVKRSSTSPFPPAPRKRETVSCSTPPRPHPASLVFFSLLDALELVILLCWPFSVPPRARSVFYALCALLTRPAVPQPPDRVCWPGRPRLSSCPNDTVTVTVRNQSLGTQPHTPTPTPIPTPYIPLCPEQPHPCPHHRGTTSPS